MFVIFILASKKRVPLVRKSHNSSHQKVNIWSALWLTFPKWEIVRLIAHRHNSNIYPRQKLLSARSRHQGQLAWNCCQYFLARTDTIATQSTEIRNVKINKYSCHMQRSMLSVKSSLKCWLWEAPGPQGYFADFCQHLQNIACQILYNICKIMFAKYY